MRRYYPENYFYQPVVEPVLPNDDLEARLSLTKHVGELLAKFVPPERSERSQPNAAWVCLTLLSETGLRYELKLISDADGGLEQRLFVKGLNRADGLSYELRFSLANVREMNCWADAALENGGADDPKARLAAQLLRQGMGDWVRDEGGTTYQLKDFYSKTNITAAAVLAAIAGCRVIGVEIS